MATINSSLSHLTESQFNLAPVPDMVTGDFVSGEESFVVLGHSLTDVNSLASNAPAAAPVVQNSIIDRIEENVETILAELSNTSAECPLPAVENHFQPRNTHESIATISSELSPDEIGKKLSSILAENQQLKHTISQNNLSMKSQYHKIMDWHADVEKTYKIHREKLEQAKQYIASLKAEITNLKETVENQAKEISNMKNADKDKCLNGLWNLNLYEDAPNKEKLSELNKLLATSQAENEKLEAQNENKLSELNKLLATSQAENEKLKAQNENKISELNKLLATSQAENENLKAELLRLNSLLQVTALSVSAEQKSMADSQKKRSEEIGVFQEEIKTLRHQLMLAQQNITEIDYAKQSQNALIALKDNEISKLADLLKNFKYTDDDMFALKTQLDLYKADFETEHNAKERILTEKNQLAEDIQHLQARNRELQEEIEVSRNHGDYSYVARDRASAPSLLQKPQKFECPKCQFNFNSLGSLENHVHRCLDLDEALP